MNPQLPQTSELPQTGPAREHLRLARHHLDLASDLLNRPDPEFRAAAVHVTTSYQRALAALTTWNRVRLPEGADVRELGRPAVRFASVLRTPVGRALAAEPVLRAVGTKERLDVHDREVVETGWYTARNLYRAVAGELPACVRAGHAALLPTATAEPRAASRRSESGSTRYTRQEREPASAERAAPAPLAARL